MNKSNKTSDAKGRAKMTQATKGKRDINNNTAFYRRINPNMTLKIGKKNKYFCLPSYLYRHQHTKKSLNTPTSKKDCVEQKQVPKGDNISSTTFKYAETSSKKIQNLHLSAILKAQKAHLCSRTRKMPQLHPSVQFPRQKAIK